MTVTQEAFTSKVEPIIETLVLARIEAIDLDITTLKKDRAKWEVDVSTKPHEPPKEKRDVLVKAQLIKSLDESSVPVTWLPQIYYALVPRAIAKVGTEIKLEFRQCNTTQLTGPKAKPVSQTSLSRSTYYIP